MFHIDTSVSLSGKILLLRVAPLWTSTCRLTIRSYLTPRVNDKPLNRELLPSESEEEKKIFLLDLMVCSLNGIDAASRRVPLASPRVSLIAALIWCNGRPELKHTSLSPSHLPSNKSKSRCEPWLWVSDRTHPIDPGGLESDACLSSCRGGS